MSALNTFFSQHPVKLFSKGEVIIRQGDAPLTAYAVKYGFIRIYNLTAHGEEKTIAFGMKDDIFPICLIFSKSLRALFYYQAHTDCELYVINKQELTDQLASSVEFSQAILGNQINWLIGGALQINALEQTGALMKLLGTFHHLSLRYGQQIVPGRVKITLPMTQQELANFTGLTRETTIHVLNKLKQQKLLSHDHRYYTIDIEALNLLVDDEYDLGITFA